MRATKYLDVDERLLLAYLSHCLDERAGKLGFEVAA
jgi:hypothetical protein